MFVRMAAGETAPLGPAAQRAKDAALKLSKAPEIRADLAKSPELIEKLRPLMAPPRPAAAPAAAAAG